MERCRHVWEDNIILDTDDIGWDSTAWINLAEEMDRLWALVNIVMNLWVPQNVGSFLVS